MDCSRRKNLAYMAGGNDCRCMIDTPSFIAMHMKKIWIQRQWSKFVHTNNCATSLFFPWVCIANGWIIGIRSDTLGSRGSFLASVPCKLVTNKPMSSTKRKRYLAMIASVWQVERPCKRMIDMLTCRWFLCGDARLDTKVQQDTRSNIKFCTKITHLS